MNKQTLKAREKKKEKCIVNSHENLFGFPLIVKIFLLCITVYLLDIILLFNFFVQLIYFLVSIYVAFNLRPTQ
jgi:type III secretory pathway component EscV